MNVWKVEGIRRDAKQRNPRQVQSFQYFESQLFHCLPPEDFQMCQLKIYHTNSPLHLTTQGPNKKDKENPERVIGDTAHLTQLVTAERHGLPWQYHGLKLGSILDSGHWKWQQNELTHTHNILDWHGMPICDLKASAELLGIGTCCKLQSCRRLPLCLG